VRERIESVQKSLGSPAYEPTVSFVKAGKTSAREISELVQKTVRTVYPKYYPQAVADFFAMFHSKDRISQDILGGRCGCCDWTGASSEPGAWRRRTLQ